MSEELANITSLKLYRARKERGQLVDPVIAHWKCRVKICIAKVGVTQTAIDVLKLFNDELRRRREREIDVDDVMVCEQHTDRLTRSRW